MDEKGAEKNGGDREGALIPQPCRALPVLPAASSPKKLLWARHQLKSCSAAVRQKKGRPEGQPESF
jgi:hypothetical protein